MGRILRTLGFDRVWTGGEGAHLIDEAGERYLDLIGGYGVFAIGRNHPEAIAAIEQVMAANTANLPQLGVSLLPGVLAEELIARSPASVSAMIPANSGTEAVEAAIKVSRAATARSRVLYAEHAFHGLTLGALSLNGNEEFRGGFGPLLEDCEAVEFGDLEALERALAGRRRGRLRGRARAGQGREPAARGLPRRAPSGCAARRARCSCATRCRRASGAPGVFSPASTGTWNRT